MFGAPVPKNGIPAQVECRCGASFRREGVEGVFEAKLQT